ncbi:unnamed protein product [Gongylonema pulchrum]|uniref:Protein-tyrosine-phosphatase n=1 Tax=Gongylonema pulchrum TaxID=637853 RepID=A0A3P6R2C6_9BILA|nr:unnamed protein product [Gongylonema pulchrum]
MQAPLKTTARDFWTMILQENVRYIFMLCNIRENGKKKCHVYYPRSEGEQVHFGEITITNMSIEAGEPTTTTQLQVEKKGTKLLLSHILWGKWPDQGVPLSEMVPFEIMKLARKSTDRPSVIHCSAGVGRSGTVVAIEMCLQTLLHRQPLNLMEVCKELRGMRAHSVQMDIQYAYIVKCLLAYGWCCGLFLGNPALIQVRFYTHLTGVPPSHRLSLGPQHFKAQRCGVFHL